MTHVRAASVLLLLAACGGDKASTPPELTVEPASLDFGTIGLGAEDTQSVTLSNLGGGTVSVLSVTLTDGDADVWIIDRNDVDEVLGGESADISITFRPEETQAYGGQVQIRTDYDEQPSWVISLSGVGGLSEADEDGDGVSVADGDCDDGNASVYPGADELCDGLDNDCNSSVPDDEADDDYDGYRVCDNDCDDDDGSVNPGATEACDDKDTDCDGINADNEDGDGDGLTVCEGDCDDTEALRSPDLDEICDDLLDNDCDGGVDDIDVDMDGHSACGEVPDCNDSDANAYPLVVSNGGSSDGDGTLLDPYDSIDTALAVLDAECRTIYLDDGSYELSLAWSDGELRVESLSGNPGDVTLTAPKASRHATITGGEVTFDSVTFTGGSAVEDGGSISITNNNTVVELRDVVMSGNLSDNDGGAVYVSNGLLRLKRGCVFEGNVAEDDGGAIYVDSATLVDEEGSQYLSNTGKKGGALYINGGDITLTDASIRSNAASVEGGGIAMTGTPSSFLLERTQFALNDSEGDGGGALFNGVDAATGVLRNNRFQDNESVSGNGGGLAFTGAVAGMVLANNTFTGNSATLDGGAMYLGATNSTNIDAVANVSHSSGPNTGLFTAGGAVVTYTTVYGTASGVDFAGEAGDGKGAPLEATNSTRSPELADFSNDNNPDNDDLTLSGGSPEIDDGPPDKAYNDGDGSPNDRGYTGGPGAE